MKRPLSTRKLRERVEVLQTAGESAAAWELLQRHRAEESDDPRVLMQAAWACADDLAADELVRRAGALAGDDLDVLTQAASWLFWRAEHESAWALAMRAQDLAPDDYVLFGSIQLVLGGIALDRGYTKDAAPALAQAYERDPENPQVAAVWADCLLRLDDDEAARQVVAIALARGDRTKLLDRVIDDLELRRERG